MTLSIIAITALMYYLDAHPIAIALGLAVSVWALTIDTREALLERKS